MTVMTDIKDKHKVHLSHFVNGLFILTDLKGSKTAAIRYSFTCYYVVSVQNDLVIDSFGKFNTIVC